MTFLARTYHLPACDVCSTQYLDVEDLPVHLDEPRIEPWLAREMHAEGWIASSVVLCPVHAPAWIAEQQARLEGQLAPSQPGLWEGP